MKPNTHRGRCLHVAIGAEHDGGGELLALGVEVRALEAVGHFVVLKRRDLFGGKEADVVSLTGEVHEHDSLVARLAKLHAAEAALQSLKEKESKNKRSRKKKC